MANAKVFNNNLKKLGKRVENNANHTKRKVALFILQDLTLLTPVDTGVARSNWLVAVQSFDRSIIEAHFPGKDGSTGAANAREALAQGTAKVQDTTSEQFIAISNNLPYIGSLNEGSSVQAPAGFVNSAVLRAESEIKGVRLLKR